jgi:hypothetical protein
MYIYKNLKGVNKKIWGGGVQNEKVKNFKNLWGSKIDQILGSKIDQKWGSKIDQKWGSKIDQKWGSKSVRKSDQKKFKKIEKKFHEGRKILIVDF